MGRTCYKQHVPSYFQQRKGHIARLGVQTSAYCCHIYIGTKVLVCPYMTNE